MLFNIHIFVILCVYFTRVVTSVVTFRSTIPGGKPNWRESSEYRDRSAVPRPPRQNTDTSRNSIPHLIAGSRPVKRVFVGFTDQGINRNPDTSADKKGKIGLPIWFSLPVGAAVPISFSDRPGYDDLRLKKTKNSDVPLASDSEKFNVPEDWTKRQNMPINIHSKGFLTEAWNRRKRAINKVSVNKRKVQIIKAPDAKRSGLPKGQTLEGIMQKLQPGHSTKKRPTKPVAQRLHGGSKTKAEPKKTVPPPVRPRLTAVQEDLEDLDS